MPDWVTSAVAVVVGVAAGLRWRRARYPENVLWAQDVKWASATGSPKRQTISDFIGDKAREGRKWALLADWLFRGHFTATSEDHARSGFYGTSFAMFLGGVVVVGVLWLKWTYPEFFVRHLDVPYHAFLLAWLLTQVTRDG